MQHARDTRRGAVALHVLLLALVVLAAYGGSLRGEFVWDDRMLIVENGRVHDPGQLDELVSSSFWETGDRHDRFRSFFRPVVGLSYFVDHALWGLSPAGFHVTNVLLHLLCCLLVYGLVRVEGIRGWIGFMAAALFAVHPVHVESVAWISGRTDLLCAVLMLAAFLLFRGSVDVPRPWPRRILAAIAFAAALFSKEMAATLPLLIAVDRWVATRRIGRSVAAAAPFVGVLLGYVAVRYLAIGGAGEPLYVLDAASWSATALFVSARYLVLLLLPLGLDAHYPYQPVASLLSPLALLSGAMVATVAIAAYRYLRHGSKALFWLLWIGITITPVLTFGRFGDVVMADRFAYLPSVGLCILAALGLAASMRVVSRPQRRVAVAMTAVILAGLGVWSHARSAVWRNDYTLFGSMVETSPGSALVHCNLGLALYERGDLERAVSEYHQAIELEPTFSMAYNNLAVALEGHGRQGEALRAYETALELAPGHLAAGINAAHLLTRTGREARGLERLREIVRRHPTYPPALYALAEALERSGQPDRALGELERVRAIAPRYPNAHYLIGKIRHDRGQLSPAADSMRTFLRLWPRSDDAWTRAARQVIRRAESAEPQR